ncbi:putative diguanylate cyclase DgcT [BD1-7 clade bacterium]|uniref:diguanylate cyclase n=1 Tax=BD1-7 clade bacterium TaxID=2029982 RepID=A0A5S9PL87_9GAMM|nr:putative diguanylate cyclase DgcT [BD1-7 clade bacterium]
MRTFIDRLIARGLALLVPSLLLISSYVALSYIDLLAEQWQVLVLQAGPILGLLLASALSIQFSRTGYFFALLFVIVASIASDAGLGVVIPYQTPIYVVLFINLLIFSGLEDRGLFSVHGILRLAVLGAETVLGVYFVEHQQQFIDYFIALHPSVVALNSLTYSLGGLPWLIGVSVVAVCIQLLCLLFSSRVNQPIFLIAQVVLLLMISGVQSELWVPLLLIAFSTAVCFNVLRQSHDMAYRDELTALPSRRALNQLLLRVGRRYTVAMMDIDHFKKFNDTHGHDIGDEVLRMVASKIARVGGGGKPHRYGGEEFTIVFSGKSPAQVEFHLEALRETIANYSMVVRSKRTKENTKKTKSDAKKGRRPNKDMSQYKTLSVTVSIGVAERTGTLKTTTQVVKAADEALYRAKKAGRNCLQY